MSDQELQLLQEPSSKKMDHHHQLKGFSKLQLPCSFPEAASQPPLRRTISEPIYSSPTTNNNNYAPPPPLPKPSYVHQEPSSLQLQLPAICRTVSDPSPLADVTPPCRRPPLPCRNHSESPSAKRLRRMKERVREMREWWDQVANDEQDGEDDEDEDQLAGGYDHDHHDHVDDEQQQQLNQEGFKNDTYDEYHHPEKKLEANKQEPAQEAVWVENTEGNCLVLHFKCPCGNGYQVLLSGSNCYYKLTSF